MLENIVGERRKKLESLTNAGAYPYPSVAASPLAVAAALRNFNSLRKSSKRVILAGRVVSLRDQGSIIFADLKDSSGKIQAVLRKNNLRNFKILKQNLDSGDFLLVKGVLFLTQKRERSIDAKTAEIVSKSLRPLPATWYGLKDVEERFRKRYLDIILNPEIEAAIKKRSEIVAALRAELWREGFTEVETPVLQPLPGGARARPFITHHNALSCDFYLRIAPELYLKRLLVAGFEKIFEIGRNFRNEGIDRDHNPEFTMLELYWVYQDWKGLMRFVEKLLKKIVSGSSGEKLSVFCGASWKKMTFSEAVKKYAKTDVKKLPPAEIDEVFKEARSKIIRPTFITNYPKTISPLAKSCPDNPEFTERFQLIVDGTEIVNGFSELNDPIEQRKRMKEQERMYRAGDEEASRLDEEFLTALEYGMPPAAGLGIGIDRLVATVAKSRNIKEVVIFPILKPKRE